MYISEIKEKKILILLFIKQIIVEIMINLNQEQVHTC